MNELKIAKQNETKKEFIKFVAMLIRKYGNLDKKKLEKEVA